MCSGRSLGAYLMPGRWKTLDYTHVRMDSVPRIVLESIAQEALAEEKLPRKPRCAASVSPARSQTWHLPASVPLHLTPKAPFITIQQACAERLPCAEVWIQVARAPECLSSEVPWSLRRMALGAGARTPEPGCRASYLSSATPVGPLRPPCPPS